MRNGELYALRWESLDFERNLVHVSDSFNKVSCHVDLTKRGYYRLVEMATPVYDCGNVDLFNTNKLQQDVIACIYNYFRKTKKIPFTIGGTYEISYHVVSNLFKNDPFNLIIFDAHMVLGDKMESFVHCGNGVTHVLSNNPNAQIFYFGIRDIERSKIKSKRVFINKKITKNGLKTYISIDVDYFDPSYISSVAYLTPNGFTLNDFIKKLNSIDFKKVVGVDVTEYLGFYNKESEHMFMNQVIFELIKTCAL